MDRQEHRWTDISAFSLHIRPAKVRVWCGAEALTVDLDVAGGHSFAHAVDGLAGVDAGVALPEAGDVQCHVTEVEGAAASRT